MDGRPSGVPGIIPRNASPGAGRLGGILATGPMLQCEAGVRGPRPGRLCTFRTSTPPNSRTEASTFLAYHAFWSSSGRQTLTCSETNKLRTSFCADENRFRSKGPRLLNTTSQSARARYVIDRPLDRLAPFCWGSSPRFVKRPPQFGSCHTAVVNSKKSQSQAIRRKHFCWTVPTLRHLLTEPYTWHQVRRKENRVLWVLSGHPNERRLQTSPLALWEKHDRVFVRAT